ncbi:MAG: hypothetical protein ACKO0V_05655 [bacterium]
MRHHPLSPVSNRLSGRNGLTILPVMASLVILSLFLAMMARQQVAADQFWRRSLRLAQARGLAESEKARIRHIRASGQKLLPGGRRIKPGELPGLQEAVEIRAEAISRQESGLKLSVKIPADADSAFAKVEWNEP